MDKVSLEIQGKAKDSEKKIEALKKMQDGRL